MGLPQLKGPESGLVLNRHNLCEVLFLFGGKQDSRYHSRSRLYNVDAKG